MTLDDLLVYEHSTRIRVNYLKIPVTVFDTTDEGMKQFNEIYAWCLEQDWLEEICRTKSGGISIKIRNLSPSFDVRMINSVIELTLITIKGAWRFQFRPIPKWLEGEDKEMYRALVEKAKKNREEANKKVPMTEYEKALRRAERAQAEVDRLMALLAQKNK